MKRRKKWRDYYYRYWDKNKQRLRWSPKRKIIDRKSRLKLKVDVLKAYSKNIECACCHEKHIEFLTIDHIKGGGNKHRKSLGKVVFYRWLKKNGFPKGYRVLCMNCNFARRYNQICPHQKKT
ncbi:MAG TPA: hypothetical protein P5110_07030 [Candidatus Omnitrophota bacterium]|nr:hypothetical protein [Candidatus Omnitrophota bacterium]